MKIVSPSDLEAGAWDGLAESSRQGWIFHLSEWTALEASRNSAENLSFALVTGGRLVALMPLYCSKLGLGLFVETLIHNGLHRHTGLALGPDLSAADVKAAQSAAMRQVMKLAGERGADRIYLAVQNLTPESRSPARAEIPHWVSEYGFQLGNSFGPAGLVPAPGLATTVADQIVDLTRPKADVFGGFKEASRRAVRKAEKAGLETVDLTGGGSCVADYYRIAKLSAERTGEAIPDITFYETIHKLLAQRGLCSFLFVRSGEHLVAATVLLHDKQGMHFFSGVSDPAFLKDRVNDYLQWAAIRFGIERGYTHYRLGPYFPSVPKGWPIETVSRFKSKFGADAWTIVQGSLFLKPERYVELARTHLAQLCEDLVK